MDARRRRPDARPGGRGLRGLRQGPQGAAVDLAALGTNGVRIEGALAGDHLGWSLTAAGDVNGDGKDDLLIGTPWADPGTPAKTSAGGARVVYGRATTTEIDLATDTQGFRIDGAADGDRAGYSVATGDVNGDGRRDFVLGAIGTACRSAALPLTCQGERARPTSCSAQASRATSTSPASATAASG